MPVHIETNGYVLRSLVPSDVTQRFADWLNHSNMLDGLNIPSQNFTVERLRAFVASFDNIHNYFIGIFDKEKPVLIGFYTLDVDLRNKVGNLTSGIGEKEYAGRRVHWATTDAFLKHMFIYHDIDKIVARVLAKNRPMLFNFIGNLHYVYEGCLKKQCRAPDGERVDLMLFAAFRDGSREQGTLP